MKYFTKSQIEELSRQLALFGVRDSDLPDVTSLNGFEEVAIIQNGTNKKVSVADIFREYGEDIIVSVKAGKSAYEIAVDHGFVGSEEDWLASLSSIAGPATTNDLGGIRLGYSANGRNYPIQLDSNSRAYVYVPWEKGEGGGGGETRSAGYYELIFCAVAAGVTPTLPTNGSSEYGIWAHSVDLSENGKVIWMADRLVTDTVGNWVGPWIISGAAGADGVDGDKMEYIYALTADPDTAPSDPTSSTPASGSPASKSSDGFVPTGWTNHPSGVSATNRAEWVSIRFKVYSPADTSGTWTAFSAASLWSVYGKDGKDGDGVEYIFYAGLELPETLPSSWTSDTDFQDPEYIRDDSGWEDDPIDIEDEGEGFGPGTRQWVCIRKYYADTENGSPYWHAYSLPSLWSYYAQDGDAGTGIVADLLPDSMAVPLLDTGYNKAFQSTSTAKLYNGAAAVAGASITAFSVEGSDGSDYKSRGWVSCSGTTITVNMSADALNLKNVSLRVTVTITGTVDSESVSRQAVLSIIGINFGTDGVSYTLDTGHAIIRKKKDGTVVPAYIYPALVEVTGSNQIVRHTPETLFTSITNLSFWYQIDNAVSATKLNSDQLAIPSSITEKITIYIYYNTGTGLNPSYSLVFRENVLVVPDGEDGGHYEQAFRSYDGEGVPAAPSTGALPAGGAWQKYAPNEGPVWMTTCWVSGSGNYYAWETPWCISGSDGLSGYDGKDYEYIYCTSTTEDAELPDENGHSGYDRTTGDPIYNVDPTEVDDFVPTGWTDDASGIDSTNRYEWMSYRYKTGSRNGEGGTWSLFSEPKLWSAWGADGTDGAGVEYIYYAGLTPPTTNTPDTWNDKTSTFQNTREYIATGSGWTDEPVDLATAAQGTKQWVSVRKKYLDTEETGDWAYFRWHAYSEPKLWSSVGRDAVINADYVDSDNDLIPVGLDPNNMNYALDRGVQTHLNHNGEPLSSGSISLSDIYVTDNEGNDYTSEDWVTDEGEGLIRINIPAGSIDLSETSLFIQFTLSSTSPSATAVGHIEVLGVRFGEDGASYDMISTTRTIWKRADNTTLPSQVGVSITKYVGLDNITSYSVEDLLALPGNKFSFTYQVDEEQPAELTSSSVPTTDVDSYLILKMYYATSDRGRILVDMEAIYVGRDGTNGKNGIRLDLDNENDSMLYDGDNNLLSGSAESIATLYDGYDDVSSQATNWVLTASGCTLSTNTGRNITVTGMSAVRATVTVSCSYKGKTYIAIMSLKKLVGEAKYDLKVTPKDVVFYNTSTNASSASEINVEIWRTAANGNGGVTKEKLNSVPAGHSFQVDGAAATYAGGYRVSPIDFTKSGYVFSLYKSSELVDQENIYIAKYSNGEAGADGTQAVCPFLGEYDPEKLYYGSFKRTDIVKYSNGKYYIAKPNAPTSPFSGKDPLSYPGYWEEFEGNYESLATGFLFAERIVSEAVETVDDSGRGILIQDNQFNAFSSNDTQCVRISGDSVLASSSYASYHTSNIKYDGVVRNPYATTSSSTRTDTVSKQVCGEFNVPSSTAVSIPALSVKVQASQVYNTTISYTITLCRMVVSAGRTSWYNQVTLGSGSITNDSASRTYTTTAYESSVLPTGIYCICVNLTFTISGTAANNAVVGQYNIQDVTTGIITIGTPSGQLIAMGSNGSVFQLGNGFRAVFIKDTTDNNREKIILEGVYNSKTFGIMLSSTSNEVMFKRPNDNGYMTLTAYITDVVNNM